MSLHRFLVLAFLFFSPVIVVAQTIRHFDISYTPTLIGLTVSGDKLKRHQWGHQVCAEISLAKSPRFSFKTGIGYSFLQAEYNIDLAFTSDNIQTWFRYYDLIVPIHTKYGFSSGPNRFYVTAGIVPSFNIGRKVLEYRGSLGSFARDVTQEQFFNRFDLPISAGLGYSYALKNFGHLYLQPTIRSNYTTQFYYFLRYLFGRRSSTNDDPPGWSSIGLTIGYAW